MVWTGLRAIPHGATRSYAKQAKIMDMPAYRETVRAAQLFRAGKVLLLVINPTFTHTDEKDFPRASDCRWRSNGPAAAG